MTLQMAEDSYQFELNMFPESHFTLNILNYVLIKFWFAKNSGRFDLCVLLYFCVAMIWHFLFLIC